MVKKSWSDITVSDFQRIYEINERDDEEKFLELIALVNGVGLDVVLEMPISRLEGHFKDIEFLQMEPKIPLMKNSYVLNGTKYRVWWKELNTAQYIDFKQMADTYYKNLPQFLTIFLIPEGHRYGDGYDLQKAAQDLSTMSIVDARAVCGFFLTAYGISTRLFLRSSARRLRRMAKKAKDPKEKEALEGMLREVEKASRLRTTGSAS